MEIGSVGATGMRAHYFENAVAEQDALWLRDGATTDDEWYAYVKNLERCGMNELLEVYQAAYDRYAEAK